MKNKTIIMFIETLLWILFCLGFRSLAVFCEENDKLDMVVIPAGEFWMGTSASKEIDVACDANKKAGYYCFIEMFKEEKPKHKVYLDAYAIDKYEVTNAQYKECVNAGKCKKPHDTKWYNDAAFPNHPVVYVDWFMADVFCKWAGKRLPTEAEWEIAARGEQGNIWPFGNTWDNNKCNNHDYKGWLTSLMTNGYQNRGTTPVGSFSECVSPYGAYDMAGNVWEWVSEAYFKECDDKSVWVADNYTSIGIVYYEQVQYEKALEYFQKAIELNARSPNDYHNIGVVYSQQGKYDKAMEYLQKALALYLKAYKEVITYPGNENNKETQMAIVIPSYHAIGDVHSAQRKYEKALEYHQKALAIGVAAWSMDDFRLAHSYSKIGEIYLKRGNLDKALGNFQRASSILLKATGVESIDLIYNIGLVYYDKSEFALAKEKFTKVINHIEKVRDNVGEDAKTMFFSRFTFAYKSLISTLFHLREYEQAFTYLEKSRARSILDEISKNSLFLNREVNEGLLLQLKESRKQIVSLNNLIARKKQAGEKTDGEAEQTFILNQNYNNALNEIYKKHPKYRALATGRIPSLSEVQNLLNDRQVFIEYSLYTKWNHIFGFIITKNTYKMVLLPGTNIKSTVEVLRETLTHPMDKKEVYYKKGNDILTERGIKIAGMEKAKEFQKINVSQAQKEANDKLYASLIEPLWNEIKDKDELIIVPDAELAFLPFEALKDKEDKYLIEKKSISYIQSASLLAKIMEKNTAAANLPILSLGGALYGTGGMSPVKNEDIYLSEAEKQYYKKQTETLLAQRGSLNSLYRQKNYAWLNIPGTEEEVKYIGNLFYDKEADRSSNTLIGNKVTEERIKEMSSEGILRNYKILHFATHGLMEPDVPELSAIVLSQPDAMGNTNATEDGYLTMGEIMTLDLNIELVNLSACETGVGKLVGGEGVTGLTQSFMMAGAKNVSVSLWGVADESTKDFMISFYNKVKEGKSYKTAMVETKREFIKGKWSEPFYWAPFVLYGGVGGDAQLAVTKQVETTAPKQDDKNEDKIQETIKKSEPPKKESSNITPLPVTIEGITSKNVLLSIELPFNIDIGEILKVVRNGKIIGKLKLTKILASTLEAEIIEVTDGEEIDFDDRLVRE